MGKMFRFDALRRSRQCWIMCPCLLLYMLILTTVCMLTATVYSRYSRSVTADVVASSVNDHLYERDDVAKSFAALRDVDVPEEIINHGPLPYHFQYDMNQPNTCDTITDLLIFVISHSSKTYLRKAIRETWASKEAIAGHKVKVLFLFGTYSTEKYNTIVQEEHEKYQDVVRANFEDSYHNLTLKSLSMLNWVLTFCRNTKYLLKADDDVYVNIDILLRNLQNKPADTAFLMGWIQEVTKVIRESHGIAKFEKWILSRIEYADDLFPAYLLGGAYAMSYRAIPVLYAASLKVNYVKLEDTFVTGLCANMAGIWRFHMHCFVSVNPCELRYQAFSRDSITSRRMRSLHKSMRNIVEECNDFRYKQKPNYIIDSVPKIDL